MSTADSKRIHAALYGYSACFDAEAVLSRFGLRKQETKPAFPNDPLYFTIEAWDLR